MLIFSVYCNMFFLMSLYFIPLYMFCVYIITQGVHCQYRIICFMCDINRLIQTLQTHDLYQTAHLLPQTQDTYKE